MRALLLLMITFSALVFTGCAAKQTETIYLDKNCPKPTLDMSKYPEPKKVGFAVHKGAIVVTIKKSDYDKMKETNQDIKDRYVSLRAWLILNVEKGLVKNEVVE